MFKKNVFVLSSRLVRQDNVKEESRINEQRSPNKRTFSDAKHILPEYDDMNQMNAYNDSMYNSENAFLEADEDETFDGNQHSQFHHPQHQQPQQQQQYQPSYFNSSDQKLPFDDDGEMSYQMRHNVENYMADPVPYSLSEETSWYGRKERSHQRHRSREFAENEKMLQNEDEHRRKPETMRSISEDTATRTAKQAVTRRTLSHPEKEFHSQVASTI